MTACVNRKHTKKVAAVVTASLVGALSLGVAPISAMAEDTGIDMLVGTEADAFSRGTVTLEGVGDPADGVYSVKANGDGSAIDVKATKVQPLTGAADAIDLEADADDYKVSIYKADEDGNPTGDAISSVVEPGRYVVTVEAVDGTYAGGTAKVQLNVKAAELEILKAYEVNPDDANDASDDKLVFTGSELSVGFAGPEDVPFTEGEDYTVKILEVGTDNVDTAESVEVLDAGTYVAYVTGMGQYAGETDEFTFDVDPFAFNAANVTVDDVIGSNTKPVHPTKVTNGKTGAEYAELDSALVSLVYVSGVDSSDLFNENGEYTFSATPDADEVKAGNITGDKGNVTVNKVGAAADFLYDDKAIEDSYTVVVNDKESFDIDKITAMGGEDELACSVEAVNAKGEVVTDDLEANETGSYTVTVSVDPADNDYKYGGSVTFTVRIMLDTIDADANVFVYYGGEVVTSVDTVYGDGNVKLSDFKVAAFNDKDKDISKDVSLKMYDADGKEITEATDAGTYTVEVVSDADYELTGTTEIAVTIAQKAFANVELTKGEDGFLTQTGFGAVNADYWYRAWSEAGTKATDLSFTQFVDADEDGVVDEGETVEFNPTSLFNVTISKDGQKVDKAVDEGTYTVHFEAKDETVAKNYVVPGDIEFTVIKAEHTLFIDVTWSDYFADPVAAVAGEHYMNGYNGTKLFGAHNSLKRGEVACILYNMAGGDNLPMDDSQYTEGRGWKSFDDVDGTMYYGRAIAWAKSAGVVNGYGDGTFNPEGSITREEFAAMLSNYAQKIDSSYVAADASVLDEYADASSVSDWATEAVAWAVENDVMGNGGFLDANGDIIRADAACMVYNYALAE